MPHKFNSIYANFLYVAHSTKGGEGSNLSAKT